MKKWKYIFEFESEILTREKGKISYRRWSPVKQIYFCDLDIHIIIIIINFMCVRVCAYGYIGQPTRTRFDVPTHSSESRRKKKLLRAQRYNNITHLNRRHTAMPWLEEWETVKYQETPSCTRPHAKHSHSHTHTLGRSLSLMLFQWHYYLLYVLFHIYPCM